MTKSNENSGICWITEQVAIGSINDVERAAKECQAILSLVPLPRGVVLPSDIDHLLVEMTDGAGNGERQVRHAVDFLNDFARDGEKVFVHCHAGRSRSVVILAIHLMEALGISRGAALAKIQSKREIALTAGIEGMFRYTRN
jgi:protein-tyrosine phosphatase